MAESRIITSQYVRIDQTPAGVGERIFARTLDYLIMALYALGMFYFIDETHLYRRMDDGQFFLLVFLLYTPVIFYSLLWEMFNQGRSPGKMAFGMRVVMRDGSTPSFGAYFMRWMFLLIDYWMSWIGLFVMLINRNNQRLGDLAAGTVIIKERDYHRIQVSLDEYNYLRKGYRPQFPQAENLSLEQVNTITEALNRYDEQRPRRIAQLAAKVKEYLKIMPADIDNEKFLSTLTRDYQYYALEEI
ncbi:MAG: RDD family protein [Tannerella sp.]|jgi:uncharacterized RDD family membrane protein YckC|nr:RDD family protein [Tannerella sp.]